MSAGQIEARWHGLGEVGIYLGGALAWVWRDGGWRTPDECEAAALRAFAGRLRSLLDAQEAVL